MFENTAVTLADLCTDVSYGYTASANEQKVGPKFLRITDIQGGEVDWESVPFCKIDEKSLFKNKLKEGDIVVARTGNSTGENYLFSSKEEAVFASYLIRFRINTGLANPYFVWLQMRTQNWWNYVAGSKSGSAQSGANAKVLGQFKVYLPERKVQDKIAGIVLGINQKLVCNSQISQTLEQIAQAIFKSWFVDFEPVRAKIAAKQNGQDPERAAMAAISGKTLDELDAHGSANAAGAGSAGAADQLSPEQQAQLKATAALFPDTLVDSELGEIPTGWVVSQIGDEVTVVGGGTPSTKNDEFWTGGDIHWTSPKDLSNLSDKVLLNTERKITKAGLAKISSGLLPVNTVLMSSRAPVGYLAIAKIPVAVNQGYIAMKCEAKLTPEFVVQWTESVMDDIKQRASGTTFAEISKKNFKIIPVIVPDKALIDEFSKIISNIYEQITCALKETKSLIEIRDSLLPKLLSGEIDLAS